MAENSNRGGQGIKGDEKAAKTGFATEVTGTQGDRKQGQNPGRGEQGKDWAGNAAGNTSDNPSTEDRRKSSDGHTSTKSRDEDGKFDGNDPSSEDTNASTDEDKMRDDMPMSGQKHPGSKTGLGSSGSTERRSGGD